VTETPDLTLLRKQISEFEQKIASLSRLQSGGGGGTSGGMEPRVAKLEASVENIQRDIADIKTDVREFRNGIGGLNVSVATMTERVSHLPTKDFIVKTVIAVLAVVAALVVFQGNIQTFLKLAH
jgi:hypothetical protein